VWSECRRSGFINKIEDFKSETKAWRLEHFDNLANKIKGFRDDLANI